MITPLLAAAVASAAASCGTFTYEGDHSIFQDNTIIGYDVKGAPAGSGNRVVPCKSAAMPHSSVRVSCRRPYDIQITTLAIVDGQRLTPGFRAEQQISGRGCPPGALRQGVMKRRKGRRLRRDDGQDLALLADRTLAHLHRSC